MQRKRLQREESEDRHERDGEDQERVSAGCAKRARGVPTLTDDQEVSTIEFIKEHPAGYADKALKDAL